MTLAHGARGKVPRTRPHCVSQENGAAHLAPGPDSDEVKRLRDEVVKLLELKAH